MAVPSLGEMPPTVTGAQVHETRRGARERRVVRLGGPHPKAILEKTDAEVRAWAVELCADMEMGYYVAPDGKQWEPRPFVIAQLLRHIGYGESTIDDRRYPQWWPGQDALRRMVALKVMIRRAQSLAASSGVPWLDAALAAACEELLSRLYVSPTEIKSRELVDLTTKLARMAEERRRTGVALPAGSKGAVRSRTFERITETIAEFEDPEERERYSKDYERVLARAAAALPERTAEPAE